VTKLSTEQQRHALVVTCRQVPEMDEKAIYASFSSSLRQFFCGEALGLLAEMILNGEAISFLVGGCRIAARGLQLWIAALSEQLRAWNVRVEDDLPSPLSPRLFMVQIGGIIPSTSRWK